MPYNFLSRLDQLGERMEALASRSVTYRRGTDTVQLPTTPCHLTIADNTTGAAGVQGEFRGYTVTVAKLILHGKLILPRNGDEIIDGSLVCRVVSKGDDASCFDYTTESRKRIRIYTTVIRQ
jgi:hypothetical protein